MAQQDRSFAVPPPTKHNGSCPVSEDRALSLLSSYLEISLERPWRHPDCRIRPEGVLHAPKSGPSGGFVLHHLRRIEAGLKGEVLKPESREELVVQFGEEVVANALGEFKAPGIDQSLEGATELPEGDDNRLDAMISNTQLPIPDAQLPDGDDSRLDAAISNEQMPPSTAPLSKEERKRKKKERRALDKAAEQKEREEKTGLVSGNIGERGTGMGQVVESPPVIATHDADGNEEKASKARRMKQEEREERRADEMDKDIKIEEPTSPVRDLTAADLALAKARRKAEKKARKAEAAAKAVANSGDTKVAPTENVVESDGPSLAPPSFPKKRKIKSERGSVDPVSSTKKQKTRDASGKNTRIKSESED